jgi:uncharacterized small protein (DUF1192 family)
MPTDKQAHQAQIGAANHATKQADARWQLVVGELNERIAELEQENSRLTQALAGDIQ